MMRANSMLLAVGLVLAAVALICAATSLSGRASAGQELLGLGDFKVSQQILNVLGLSAAPQHPQEATPASAARAPRYPHAIPLTKRTRSTLSQMSRLNKRLASLDTHDRDVVFRLEKRRLALAQCDDAGCRAASPDALHTFDEYKEEMRNIYRTSGGSQQPKSVGTFRIGDPVVNKYDKSIYRRKCENDRDCITDDWRTLSNTWQHDPEHEQRQRLWRKTHQLDRSIDISANDDMQSQMESLIKDTQRSIDECNQQFLVVSDDAIKHCERRSVRHTCYVFESQSQLCDFASQSTTASLTRFILQKVDCPSRASLTSAVSSCTFAALLRNYRALPCLTGPGRGTA